MNGICVALAQMTGGCLAGVFFVLWRFENGKKYLRRIVCVLCVFVINTIIWIVSGKVRAFLKNIFESGIYKKSVKRILTLKQKIVSMKKIQY